MNAQTGRILKLTHANFQSRTLTRLGIAIIKEPIDTTIAIV